MDSWQTIFDIAIAVGGFFGGFLLNRIFIMLDRIEKDVRNMPLQYVIKDDYRRDIDYIKGMLGDIFEELKGKADK